MLPYGVGSDTIYPRATGAASVRFQRLIQRHPGKSMVVCMPKFPNSGILARREASVAIIVYSLQLSEGDLGSVVVQDAL